MIIRSKRLIIAGTLLLSAVGSLALYRFGRSIWYPVTMQVTGKRTVAQVVEQYGPVANERLAPYFVRAGVDLQPSQITLIGLKEEKRLELWAEKNGRWVFIRDYEVKRASGTAGPKLREGDEQVPEGFYKIEGLNPNSSYHLSLKLNYPNEFDRQQGVSDGRTQLGGDIFIHGKAVSIGCLAMGDEVIEELFVFVDRVGKDNVSVIIAPHDFRTRRWINEPSASPWIGNLYAEIDRELNNFKQ